MYELTKNHYGTHFELLAKSGANQGAKIIINQFENSMVSCSNELGHRIDELHIPGILKRLLDRDADVSACGVRGGGRANAVRGRGRRRRRVRLRVSGRNTVREVM